jgi:hypothetical protein
MSAIAPRFLDNPHGVPYPLINRSRLRMALSSSYPGASQCNQVSDINTHNLH